jgi:hypothetical protein
MNNIIYFKDYLNKNEEVCEDTIIEQRDRITLQREEIRKQREMILDNDNDKR